MPARTPYSKCLPTTQWLEFGAFGWAGISILSGLFQLNPFRWGEVTRRLSEKLHSV